MLIKFIIIFILNILIAQLLFAAEANYNHKLVNEAFSCRLPSEQYKKIDQYITAISLPVDEDKAERLSLPPDTYEVPFDIQVAGQKSRLIRFGSEYFPSRIAVTLELIIPTEDSVYTIENMAKYENMGDEAGLNELFKKIGSDQRLYSSTLNQGTNELVKHFSLSNYFKDNIETKKIPIITQCGIVITHKATKYFIYMYNKTF